MSVSLLILFEYAFVRPCKLNRISDELCACLSNFDILSDDKKKSYSIQTNNKKKKPARKSVCFFSIRFEYKKNNNNNKIMEMGEGIK